jgi:putative pyruvate formate lyase activating enzyme
MEITAHTDIPSRLRLAWEALQCCNLCPRHCGKDRTQGEKGFCGLGYKSHCFREMVFNHEESTLNPSHQIYFTGCNLRCDYCSVAEWNQQPICHQHQLDVNVLAQKIMLRRRAGAKTLNLLGGEPTVNIYGILTLLEKLPVDTTVVWNSNMYYEKPTQELIDSLIDIYLADFKCGNDSCASLLLGTADYTEIIKKNISFAAAKKQVIVRHLLVPGHFDCCTKPILRWLAESAVQALVSIKGDYIPPACTSVLPTEYTTPQEFTAAMDAAKYLGLNITQ